MADVVSEKLELLSPKWIERFRDFLTTEVTPEDVAGVTYSMSWEAMNAPAHLRHSPGGAVGCHLRIQDGKVEVGDQPLWRADCALIIDYDVMAESYRNSNEEEGRWMRERAPQYFSEGRIRAYGNAGPAQKIMVKYNVRERVWAAITK